MPVGGSYRPSVRNGPCKAAAFALYSYGVTDRIGGYDLEQGLKFKDMFLRKIPEDLFKEFGVRLPNSWQKRVRHFYSEMSRVSRGLEYWKAGDLVSYGRLINESGMSSIVNYECGSPELIKLYDVLQSFPVYMEPGSRVQDSKAAAWR